MNDVILASVSGGLRRLLEDRGERPDASLVAMVPVSTRPAGQGEELGNQISGMLVSLASDVDDPVARLDAIAESSRVAKEQEKLHRGRLVGDLAQMALPAFVSAAGARHGGDAALRQGAPTLQRGGLERARPRLFAVLRGESGGGHVPGRADRRGDRDQCDCAVVSRPVHFGLFACRRLLPELHDLASHVDEALAELVACALDARGATA